MALDLIGHKYGALTVLAKHDMTKSGARWLCECDCNSGATVVKYTTQLRRGGNIGCSCCETQRRSAVNVKHGGAEGGKSSLYMIWKGMRSRCRDKGNTSYAYYGAKGIAVCAEWDDYAEFREWAGVNGWADEPVEPKHRMSIDRVNSSEHYTPANCRFITRSENSKRVQ